MDNKFLNEMIEKADRHHMLYHYTSIKALYSILSNESIRFSRLDKLNDLVEAKRANRTDADHYVACFSNVPNESIPLWYMYADRANGVRIGITNNIKFDREYYCFDGTDKIQFTDEYVTSSNLPRKAIMLDKGHIPLSDIKKIDVRYSNIEVEKKTYVKNEVAENYEIQTVQPHILVGIKGEAWEYESETRFYMTAHSHNRMDIEFIYAEYNKSFYDGLEITFSPFINQMEMNNILNNIHRIIGKESFDKINFCKSQFRDTLRSRA